MSPGDAIQKVPSDGSGNPGTPSTPEPELEPMRDLGTTLSAFIPDTRFATGTHVEDGQRLTDYDLDGDGKTDVVHRQGANDASIQRFRQGDAPRRDTYHAGRDGKIDQVERLEYFRMASAGDAYV